MTSHAASASKTAVLAVVLGLAAASWAVALRQMRGMDMGVATDLGSLRPFLTAWVAMMAAMMLPGAAPAAATQGRLGHGLLFAGSYLAVWAVVGVVVYGVYRPHTATIAGALTIAAGLYELTPRKRDCRLRCRENVRAGGTYGVFCVGSSGGLMLILVALGLMSVTWMTVVASLVVAQKLLPPRAALDIALALAIVGLGIVVAVAPSSIPGIAPM
jgi:predicted metal-binding membrane protein